MLRKEFLIPMELMKRKLSDGLNVSVPFKNNIWERVENYLSYFPFFLINISIFF
jgi:hypothetical protein